MRIFQNAVLILSVLILAGCSSAPAETGDSAEQPSANTPPTAQVTAAPIGTAGPTPTAIFQAEAVGTPSAAPAVGGTQAQSLSDRASQDLAQRLSLTLNDIHVTSVAPVIWPDASLGCPQPGMMYAQMQTPGFLIKLNANDKEYEYHTDKGENMVDCENGVPAASGAPGVDALVEKAKQDLAGRLSLPVAGISLVESASVTWPDSSIGCPAPDMMYAQILTPGYRIILSAGDKHYEYHTGHNQAVVFCANPK